MIGRRDVSLTPFSIGMPPCSKCAVVTCGMSSSGGSARPPVKSVEGGAGAGDGAWEKLAGCREAGAATGIGGANGRAEDCPGVDGALGEDVMVETGASAA